MRRPALAGYFRVAGRVAIEGLLWCLGALNVGALFHRRPVEWRVAVQAYAAHLAQFSSPVVAGLHGQSWRGQTIRVECIVLPHPHFARAEQRRVEAWAADMGVVARPYWRSLWRRYDLVLYLDVFAGFPLRRVRSVLMMHGPGLTGRTVERSPFRKTMADFDVVLVSGEFDRALAEPHPCLRASGTRVIASGTPFLDRAQLEVARASDYRTRLGLPETTRLVLVAPSWSGLRTFEEHGLDWLSEVIAEVSATPSCSVVVKLHAASLAGFIGGPTDWQARLNRWSATSSVVVDDHIDDRPALMHADLLVTDISSRAFAMMMIDKPVLLHWPLRLSRDAWDDQRSTLLQRGALVTTTRAELRSALAEPWAWGDRAAVAAACFANQTSAVDTVLARVRAELDTVAPSA